MVDTLRTAVSSASMTPLPLMSTFVASSWPDELPNVTVTSARACVPCERSSTLLSKLAENNSGIDVRAGTVFSGTSENTVLLVASMNSSWPDAAFSDTTVSCAWPWLSTTTCADVAASSLVASATSDDTVTQPGDSW